MIERFTKSVDHLQKRQLEWYKGVELPLHDLNVHRKTLNDEVGELNDIKDLNSPQNRTELTSELSDIILIALGLLGIMGIPAHKALDAKLNRNMVKYNPEKIVYLRQQGMGQGEAMSHQKSQWDKCRDILFFHKTGAIT